MKRGVILATIATALLLNGCSQSESRVPVHRYDSQNSGAGSLGIHTIHSGDTLWSVANAYRVDLRDLLDANHLSAPFHVYSGQRLKIPAPMTYKTRKGDTLYKVSRMFDTTTTELARLNSLRSPYLLNGGQNLRLPSKHTNLATIIRSAPLNHMGQGTNYTPQKLASIQREELLPDRTITTPDKPASQPRQEASAESVDTNTIPMSLSLNKKGFLKPVSGKIISGFGVKSDGLHNDGINIRATRGDPVRASEQGVVVYSGDQIEGYGNMLLIRHANGYMTAYAHMDKSLVKKGDRVKRGQAIGTVGTTGHVDTPQLHFEIRKGKDAINPSQYMVG